MTCKTSEILRYQGRLYDMESDLLNTRSLTGGADSSGLRDYDWVWEILDNRLYRTTLMGDLKDSKQGLSAESHSNLERIFEHGYTGTIKCPLGIGHEVTSGGIDHPAHLVISVAGGIVHDAKEVQNLRFGEYFNLANDTPKNQDESFFVVRKDRIELHYRDERQDHRRKEVPLFNSLSLPVFADFVLRYRKYSLYMRHVERIRMTTMYDYEGHPKEDRYSFFFDGSSFDDARTMLFVTFHSCWSETDYDYIALTAADRSTAYKFKPAGPKGATKFKIQSAQCIRRLGCGQAWFIAEMQRLKVLLDSLDAATQTLQNWADSGLSMRVDCSNGFGCGRPRRETGDIPASRLGVFAEKGWSIEEFKQKLKCRECGSPASDIHPFPTADEGA